MALNHIPLASSLASLLSCLSLFSLLPSSLVVDANNNYPDGLTLSLTRRELRSSSGAASSPLTNPEGAAYYVMDIGLGTPRVSLQGAIDTTNELTWFQCKPSACYDQTNPTIYDPKSSHTYLQVRPDSAECRALGDTSKNNCPYSWIFADGSSSQGVISSDIITVGGVPIPNQFFFGCGRNNSIGAGDGAAPESGFIGLGRSPYSLISQMGTAAGQKFSYLLAGKKNKSYIRFGAAAAGASGAATVVPLASGRVGIFHYLRMDKITVSGVKSLPFPGASGGGGGGNIIISTGTALTLLPRALYDGLVSAAKQAVKAAPFVPPENPDMLCYKTAKSTEGFGNLTITMGFGNANLKLSGANVFVATEKNVVCLAFAAANPGSEAMLGSLAQENFVVGFDLDENTVTFERCNS